MAFDMFYLPLVECSGSSSMLCSFGGLSLLFFFLSPVSDYDGALEQRLQTQRLAGLRQGMSMSKGA